MSEPNFNFNINTNPTGSPTLGSVSHSYRKKNFQKAIKEARQLLILIGVLIIVGNVFMTWLQWSDVEKAFDETIRQEERNLAPGMVIDRTKLGEARDVFYAGVYIVLGLMVAVGVILIALGMTVHLAPMPIAVSALAIYLGYHAILAVMDPTTIAHGWLWKFLMIAGLFKVISSAKAYQNDLRKVEAELAAQGGTLPLQ